MTHQLSEKELAMVIMPHVERQEAVERFLKQTARSQQFALMLDKIFNKISAGEGKYYVYVSSLGAFLCTHLKPVKDHIVAAEFGLELVGVYTPEIERKQLFTDICYLWKFQQRKRAL